MLCQLSDDFGEEDLGEGWVLNMALAWLCLPYVGSVCNNPARMRGRSRGREELPVRKREPD